MGKASAGLIGFALASALLAQAVAAAPLEASRTYQFLDNVSPNSVGIPNGARQQLGANCVVPLGTACTPQAVGAPFGTTGSATQGGVSLPLNFIASDLTSNHFSIARPPAAIPDGSWTLTFNNGPDVAVANTPTLGTNTPMGFATAVSLSGGTSPTFSWITPAAPAGLSLDSVTVLIRDLSDFRGSHGVEGQGTATIIYRRVLAPSTTSLTVAPNDPNFFGGVTALQGGKSYSLEIQAQDTRNNLVGGGFANVIAQSRSLLDFQLLPASAPPQVYLPMIDTSGAVPVHRFQPIPVAEGQLIFIDPVIAVGYDYQTGLGDPNFASVLLPTGIGDNVFDLWLWNNVNWFDTGSDLLGGVEFLFGPGGVDRFRIAGIEENAFLDPFSSTAFITGVSFVADGTFSGTMTPLVVDIAQVPEPPTLALLLLALMAACAIRKSTHRRD